MLNAYALNAEHSAAHLPHTHTHTGAVATTTTPASTLAWLLFKMAAPWVLWLTGGASQALKHARQLFPRHPAEPPKAAVVCRCGSRPRLEALQALEARVARLLLLGEGGVKKNDSHKKLLRNLSVPISGL